MALRLRKGKVFLLFIVVLLIVGYVYREQVSTVVGHVFIDINSEPVRDAATEEDVVAYEAALEHKDVELCRALTFEDFRLDCIKQVAVAQKSIEICGSIEVVKVKHSCFADISAAMNDVEVCEQIKEDEYWSDICYHNYAVANDDAWYCLFIEKGAKNNPCYYDVAVSKNDWALCNEITDDDMHTRCNFVISKNALSVEPCKQMRKLLDRDVCMLKFAEKVDDVDACENIEFYPKVKEDCINKLKR